MLCQKAGHTLPAEAFVQASCHQEVWHQGASDQVPFRGEASYQEGAYKVAGLACASYEGPGSLGAFPKKKKNAIVMSTSTSICPSQHLQRPGCQSKLTKLLIYNSVLLCSCVCSVVGPE